MSFYSTCPVRRRRSYLQGLFPLTVLDDPQMTRQVERAPFITPLLSGGTTHTFSPRRKVNHGTLVLPGLTRHYSELYCCV